jgi:hypothetical protein
LPLNFIAQLLLGLQDTTRRRADSAVVEVNNARVQHPVLAHGMTKHSDYFSIP